jgi:hypothetical protein
VKHKILPFLLNISNAKQQERVILPSYDFLPSFQIEKENGKNLILENHRCCLVKNSAESYKR